MTAYRLYFLDHANHIRDVAVIEAETDEAACAAVALHDDGRNMELWLRDRVVRAWRVADS